MKGNNVVVTWKLEELSGGYQKKEKKIAVNFGEKLFWLSQWERIYFAVSFGYYVLPLGDAS